MRISRVCLLSLAAVLPSLFPLIQASAEEPEGYGTITGQFVLDGEIPQPKLLIKKGDPGAKDPAVCAAGDLYEESLLVDPESKGIANIFVYYFSPTAPRIHPDLKESKQKKIVFDQKGCRFIPHALLVRTDQTVVVKSDDNCQHNTHVIPFRNGGVNFIAPPNDRKGQDVSFSLPERYLTKVKCDIHAWMTAYWLILDHPYAAITDGQGTFTIEKVPAGEHDFRVWQERSGWVNAGEQRGFKVTVKPGETVDLGSIKVPVAKFEE